MTEQAPPTSTALVIPETGAAIARIVSDLKRVAAKMLPSHGLGDGGKRRRLSDQDRMDMIESLLIISPTSAGVPFITTAIFGGERKRVGSKLVPVVKDGRPQYDGDGRQEMCWAPDLDLSIVGKAELPDPRDSSKRVNCDVEPLILCDRRGDLVPYVRVDERTGHFLAGPVMHCLFIHDVNPDTGRRNGRIRALPLGLGDVVNINHYNGIVSRRGAQDSTSTWMQITPIANNIGRAVKFLLLKPGGVVATNGLVPVWKGWHFDDLDKERCDYYIVDRLGGKAAVLDHKSQNIVFDNGEVVELCFLIEETWNSVKLRVWGIPGEVGMMEMRELEQKELTVDWIHLLGGSLYSITPRSGTTLIRNGLPNPPVDEMVSLGLLPMGATQELAREVLRSFRVKIIGAVETTVTQARDTLVHELGAGGSQNPGLSLADVLGGEPTPELLRQVHDNPTQENLLVIGIVTSKTAMDLGLEDWNPNCWILREAYKTLLIQLARQAGIEMAPKPEPEIATPPVESSPPEVAPGEQPPASATPPIEGEPPVNGSAEPAIVWHEGLGRDELYRRAKAAALAGITSRATKPQLVAALAAVCQPTPPATS